MARQTVEQSRILDVGWCNERGLFQNGVSGVITWTRERDGEEVASVGHVFVDDGPVEALVLFYTIRPNWGQEGPRDVSYPIPIEYTECNFGGERPWFRCPVCDDRVAKLYKTPKYDQYACRDCGDLLYESQTYRKPIQEAFDRLDDATERIEEGELTHEALKEVYDAKQGVSAAFNSYMENLDKRYGDFGRPVGRHRMDALPPFEEWADDLFHKSLGSPGGRDYGIHGRCVATAKTRGERCLQPATGEHGKCYYHGGAPGSGVGKGQVNRQAEAARERIQQYLEEWKEHGFGPDELLTD